MKIKPFVIIFMLILAITSFAFAESNNELLRDFTADEQAYDVFLDLSHVFDYGVRYLDEMDRLWSSTMSMSSVADVNSSWFYDTFLFNNGNANVERLSVLLQYNSIRYGNAMDEPIKLYTPFSELMSGRTKATDAIWAGIAMEIDAHYLEAPKMLKEYLDNAMAGIRTLMRIDRNYPFLEDLQNYYKEAALLYEYIDNFEDNYTSFNSKRDDFSKNRSSYAIDFQFIFDTTSGEYAYVQEVRANEVAERNRMGWEKAQGLEDAGDYEGAIALYWEYYSAASVKRIDACREIMQVPYQNALRKEQEGDYEGAIIIYESMNGYGDSKERIKECIYQIALRKESEKDRIGALELFQSLGEYRDSNEHISSLSYKEVGRFNGFILLRWEDDYVLTDVKGNIVMKIKIGQKAVSDKWGEGNIYSISPMGNGYSAVIAFPNSNYISFSIPDDFDSGLAKLID